MPGAAELARPRGGVRSGNPRAIDVPFICAAARPREGRDAELDAIAESYWHRVHQDRSAREHDVRPFKQSF